MAVEIHTLSKIKLKRPTVVVGLPGTGLVGSIAAAYLVDSLNLEFAGYITSPEFAPLASIHNYRPYPPARIHVSREHNLIVILSEMSIPVSVSTEFADQVMKFSSSLGARQIISVGGISLKENPNDLYVISSDEKISKEFLAMKKYKPIREGATTGVSGVLLTTGVISNFPVTLILGEANEDFMDPGAASNVLKALCSHMNIKLDTKKLDEEAKEVADEMRMSVVKSKIPKKGGFGSMYG